MENSTPLPSVWRSLKNSFYNPDFYKQVPRFPFGKVMAYLLLITTISYISFLGTGAIQLWQDREEIQQEVGKILDSYPEGLELTFTDGHLTSNVQEPYFFPEEGIEKAFEGHAEVTIEDNAPTYFVVIDTQTPFSVEQFQTYDSVIWLTGDVAYMQGENTDMSLYPYDKDLNQVVNRQTVEETIQDLLIKLKTPLIVAGSVLLVLGDFILFLYYFAYLAFAALIYYIFSQASGKKHEYPDCYRIATYALTPAWAINLLIQLLNLVVPISMPPFLFTAVLLLTVFFNVHHKDAASKKE